MKELLSFNIIVLLGFLVFFGFSAFDYARSNAIVRAVCYGIVALLALIALIIALIIH